MAIDLTTRYLGFELANPLVVGACPLTGDMTTLQRLEAAGAAAVVLPSLFEEQLQSAEGRPATLLNGGDGPLGTPHDLDNYNAGPDGYLRLVEQAKNSVSVPVIASFNGSTQRGWTRFAQLIEGAGADAIELNIFYIATDIETTAAELEQRHLDIVAAVRTQVSIPIAVKIGPYFSALPNFAARLVDAGADGIVLFNRFLEPEFDLDTFEIRPHIEFSRQSELRLPLRWIAILKNQVNVSLALTSGIQDVHDVVKALLAGADVTMLASALLRYGPEHLQRLVTGLHRWLESHDLGSVSEIQGMMSLDNGERYAGLLRGNYLHALSKFATPF